MTEKEKLIKISEKIALLNAGQLISTIHRGDKIVYPAETKETEEAESFGMADIKRV